MKLSVQILFSLILIVLVGCQRDIPKPKSKENKSSAFSLTDQVARVVAATPHPSSFTVRHQINGKNVLIECKLQDISFRHDLPDKQVGKIIVLIDGKKTEEVDSPVFILKDLTSGQHTITLQVVNLANQPYPLKKEINVDIQ
ncbi:hypothetical protein HHO41_16840 [Bacillus sp. DNRA2]|uniref:hypothetical protein n=1 Tax=Bacillus sp. DNRA2 TaxID=2723053 RepID=UPI00145F9DD8|nr:hypothetical protein [Bacillus sp. DNRA2]NMD71968.1 hypothetical protein [Bacillus sp. DNRA2]